MTKRTRNALSQLSTTFAVAPKGKIATLGFTRADGAVLALTNDGKLAQYDATGKTVVKEFGEASNASKLTTALISFARAGVIADSANASEDANDIGDGE